MPQPGTTPKRFSKPRHESGIKAKYGGPRLETDSPPPVVLELLRWRIAVSHRWLQPRLPAGQRRPKEDPWGRSSGERRVAKAGIRGSRCASRRASMWEPTPRQHPGCRISNGSLQYLAATGARSCSWALHKPRCFRNTGGQKAAAGWFPLGGVSWPIWLVIVPQTVSSLELQKSTLFLYTPLYVSDPGI